MSRDQLSYGSSPAFVGANFPSTSFVDTCPGLPSVQSTLEPCETQRHPRPLHSRGGGRTFTLSLSVCSGTVSHHTLSWVQSATLPVSLSHTSGAHSELVSSFLDTSIHFRRRDGDPWVPITGGRGQALIPSLQRHAHQLQALHLPAQCHLHFCSWPGQQ